MRGHSTAGLEYCADFLAPHEEAELLAQIDGDDSPWLDDLSRRVQHFGYKYDYSNRRLDATARIGPLPDWLRDCFGPNVATVSLGSAINMDFRCDATGHEYIQRLEPRSLVVLHGAARSEWRHGIAKRQTDTWGGHKSQRQRRVSITFRTIASWAAAESTGDARSQVD